jgi:biotin carboxyl carrier protein
VTLTADTALDLLRAVRSAREVAERRFILLNRTRESVPYHAAVLWQGGELAGHSGASHVDPHGPYGQWLMAMAPVLRLREGAGIFTADEVPQHLKDGWQEWWPPHALWLPAPEPQGTGWLLVREMPWLDDELRWLAQWWALWLLADQAASSGGPRRVVDWQALLRAVRSARPWKASGRRRWIGLAIAVAVALLPVRLTVRAPGEIVPREPTVLRATIEGMAQKLHVEPNQAVRAGELLAVLDDAAAASRLQVARQALVTAEAEWRQTLQQALSDPRAKAQLAVVQGRVEERRTEVAYLGEQVRRTELRAPHDGVVLVDDPGAWAGRTVAAGEPLLRVARPADQEVEAWLSVADAVELPDGSPMKMFLSSRPASPVAAQLRLYSYEPQLRPDGTLAYRLRGRLNEAARERLGARGTVHVDGPRVPLVYWVLRRPLAAMREATGW